MRNTGEVICEGCGEVLDIDNMDLVYLGRAGSAIQCLSKVCGVIRHNRCLFTQGLLLGVFSTKDGLVIGSREKEGMGLKRGW